MAMTLNLKENEYWYLKAMLNDQHELLERVLHKCNDDDDNVCYEVTRQQIVLVNKMENKMKKLIYKGAQIESEELQ